MGLRSRIEKYHPYLLALLFFLMFFFPYNIVLTKTMLMGLLILMTCLRMRNIRVSKAVLVFMLLFLTYAFLASCIGAVKGNPGWTGFARLNIIYYVALFFCIAPIKRDRDIVIIIKSIYYAALAISFYAFIIVIYYKGLHSGLWKEIPFLLMDDFLMVGFHESYVHITNTNMSMMSIVLPIIVLAYEDDRVKQVIGKTLYWLTVMTSSFACLLSGRRILWIVGILVVGAYFIKLPKEKKENVIIGGGIALIVGIFILNTFTSFSVMGLVNRLVDAFLSTDTLYGGENVRYASIRELFKGFMENIWWGSGAGIGVDTVVRNTLEPWCYEVSYSLILYNSGIIGSGLYVGALLIIMISLFRMKNDKLAYALGVAYMFGIVANGTNPYFSGSFDFLTFIFVPLAYVNVTRVREKNG